jgi:hypothetical protein
LPVLGKLIRKVQFPFEPNKIKFASTILVHKNCAGIYKQYTDIKQREYDFHIIKARIAKAAGHKEPAKPIEFWNPTGNERPVISFIPPTPINCRSTPFPTIPNLKDRTDATAYAIHGHKASTVIIDDIECDHPEFAFDKNVLLDMWTKITDSKIKEALHGTNSIQENPDNRPTSYGRSTPLNNDY